MKTQIKKELHNKSVAELREQLKEARVTLRKLRLEKETGRLKNTSSLGAKRVETAVLQTIIREKSVKGEEMSEVKKSKSASTKAPASAKAKAGRSANKEGGKK
jgi:ribosomal protein L29